ncbi:uncharacterized protein LOC108102692 isoform X2 [Drosophila eugracilis]|uniref:uncharacterized protein LOC108102692 isoform X2 n=1 Tax=Drosophila eugracilis TaxID=29029 RepID=UPI0007E6CD4E|nr:uncharacterized protein LOC108102692 isoform X2 [Drosophila eugracilis]
MGLSHTIARINYMKRYEDPKKVLNEEHRKAPCKRYFEGYCKFEMYCKYSHYSKREFQELEKIVIAKKNSKSRNRKNSNKWPWKTHLQRGLPPSLQPITLAKLQQTNFELSWG